MGAEYYVIDCGRYRCQATKFIRTTACGKKANPISPAGFKTQEKLYFAAWDLGEKLQIPIPALMSEIRIGYPQASVVHVRATGKTLEVIFIESL